MRLSEGPRTEVSVEIEAPAEVVWDIITDLNTPAATSSEFRGAEWTPGHGPDEDGAIEVGASFVGHSHHEAIGEWSTTSYVIAAYPLREFAWAVEDPDTPAAVWRYCLDIQGKCVHLSQQCQLGPGPNGLTPAIERMPEKEDRIITRRLEEHRTNMRANLAYIRELAEARALQESPA